MQKITNALLRAATRAHIFAVRRPANKLTKQADKAEARIQDARQSAAAAEIAVQAATDRLDDLALLETEAWAYANHTTQPYEKLLNVA